MSFRASYGAAAGPPVNLKFTRANANGRDPDDHMVLVDVVVNRRNATFKVWKAELPDFCRRHGIPVPDKPRKAK